MWFIGGLRSAYFDESDSTHYVSSRRYEKNGKLKYVENYNNGLLHGESRYYRANGSLKVEIFYQDGIIVLKNRKLIGSKPAE